MVRIALPDGEGTERERMWRLRPGLGAAAEAYTDAVKSNIRLDPRVREAVRFRIAQINACPV